MADALQRQKNGMMPYSGPVCASVSMCAIEETNVAPTAIGLHRTDTLRLESAMAVYVYTSQAAQHSEPSASV